MTANGLRTWQEICSLKREQRDNAIPVAWRIPNVENFTAKKTNLLDISTSCGILTEDEVRITSDYDAVGIVEAIREKVFTAEAVTTAFCKRAAIAQQLTNCLTEMFFEEAIENAKALDRSRVEHPDRPLGPFYGLPISLKDSFKLEGKDATIGMTCFVAKPATQDSSMVTMLKSFGAILYCKTNVPQTMMTADSDNNVFGRTLNPNNTRLTAGGSTGGEGSLIALRGSILGVGTDIAGSIRIPSSANGIYGFKPSSQIIPYAGQQSPAAPGSVGITPSAGPMATSIRSCQYFIKMIMEADPCNVDASVYRIPWLENTLNRSRPLRIGVIADDTLHTPTPPMRRALREAVEKLTAANQTIVPLTLPDVSENMGLIWDLFSLDGSKFTVDLIESTTEPFVPSVVKTGLMTQPARSLEDYFRLNHQRNVAVSTFQSLWLANDLDVILTLPAPHTAVPFDEWSCITYTAMWNMYDCPACVIPVGKVSASLDKKDEEVRYGEKDRRVYDLYTGPEDYADAPISVQLVGRKQRDEELANIAVLVDGILNPGSA
ncbi:amidase [Rhexocercosporidium sp. MPI-PUGE-AT-0058]|nr:amidase [Rhexocercosporidium sp. MPI-PUGE-AT-0058]